MIVVDEKGIIKGILTPINILSVLRSTTNKSEIKVHFGIAYASRLRKLPTKTPLKVSVVSIMDKHPLILEEEDVSLSEAMERMSSERINY